MIDLVESVGMLFVFKEDVVIFKIMQIEYLSEKVITEQDKTKITESKSKFTIYDLLYEIKSEFITIMNLRSLTIGYLNIIYFYIINNY
jgi:stage III sporulation protein SpoIIIAA